MTNEETCENEESDMETYTYAALIYHEHVKHEREPGYSHFVLFAKDKFRDAKGQAELVGLVQELGRELEEENTKLVLENKVPNFTSFEEGKGLAYTHYSWGQWATNSYRTLTDIEIPSEIRDLIKT